MRLDRDEIAAVARRHHARLTGYGGISPEACCVLAVAELGGEPLDVFAFGDAAVVCRAERLVMDRLSASEALTVARKEMATWAVVGG